MAGGVSWAAVADSWPPRARARTYDGRMRVLIAAIATTLVSTAAHAGMRCGQALVTAGRTALELTTACGPPAHVARRTVIEPGADPDTRTYEEVETWTYPGDGATFTRLVEVRRGRVASIQTAGYDLAPMRCSALLSAGTTVGELALACGAPADRAAWVEERLDAKGRPRRLIHHERWTVSGGPGQLLRVLVIEDGRLVRVETGGRLARP